MELALLDNYKAMTMAAMDSPLSTADPARWVVVHANTMPAGGSNVDRRPFLWRILTLAPAELDEAPITRAMRDLICRCMADNPNVRPNLEFALAVCRDAVLNMGERDYDELHFHDDAQIHETDAFLRHFINRLVLDAEVNAEQERLRHGRRATAIAALNPGDAAAHVDRERRRAQLAFGVEYGGRGKGKLSA
ncbi:RNA-splicing factor [Diatrype stigma]|uniref:RNA-splicing factor n=1 Tax=Diatrype stigma TaxID=117547 RepID=A0AAN9UXC9_9PEZI